MASKKNTKGELKKKDKTIAEKLLNKEPVYQINIFLQGLI